MSGKQGPNRARYKRAKQDDLSALAGQAEQRFWSNVQRAADNECWPWRGKVDRYGYGKLYVGVKRTPEGKKFAIHCSAHRVSFYLYHGWIPDDLLVCHACDVRDCVNPLHLWVGTDADNNRDMQAKGRWSGGTFKIPNDDVRRLRERFPVMPSDQELSEAARALGVKDHTLRAILAGWDRREAGGPVPQDARAARHRTAQRSEIKRRRQAGEVLSSIGAEFNITPSTVYRIAHDSRW